MQGVVTRKVLKSNYTDDGSKLKFLTKLNEQWDL